VTLGANECEDLEVVVSHLRSKNMASTLGLWGRSMGAVTALMYTARDPSVAGVVADSPFSNLPDLLLEIVQDQKLPIPKFLLRFVLFLMKRSVKSRANFDLDKVSPVQVMRTAFIPAVFGHGKEDDFIRPHHSQRLFDACSSVDKRLLMFDGSHNSQRPEFYYSNVSQFFHQSLRLDEMIEGGNQLERQLLGGMAVRHVSSNPYSQHESRPGGNPSWSGRPVEQAAASLCTEFVEDEAGNLNLDKAAASIRRWGETARMEMQSSRGGIISELMSGSLRPAEGPGGGQVEASAGLRVQAVSQEEVVQDDDEVTKQMIEDAIRMSLLEAQEKKGPDEASSHSLEHK
jgi:hypothetical protein